MYFDFLNNIRTHLHVWVHTCTAKHMAAHTANVTACRGAGLSMILTFLVFLYFDLGGIRRYCFCNTTRWSTKWHNQLKLISKCFLGYFCSFLFKLSDQRLLVHACSACRAMFSQYFQYGNWLKINASNNQLTFFNMYPLSKELSGFLEPKNMRSQKTKDAGHHDQLCITNSRCCFQVLRTSWKQYEKGREAAPFSPPLGPINKRISSNQLVVCNSHLT